MKTIDSAAQETWRTTCSERDKPNSSSRFPLGSSSSRWEASSRWGWAATRCNLKFLEDTSRTNMDRTKLLQASATLLLEA